MQNAKDTFYETMRGRLAALNPERTVVVRGVSRPGVLVQENEFTTTVHVPDCFRLNWTQLEVDAHGPLPLVTMQCVVEYETAGTLDKGGMDRGRALAAMDKELQAAVNATPQTALKSNYSALANGGGLVTMATNVWWGDVAFGKAEVKGDRLHRTATVAVMSYQEAGER